MGEDHAETGDPQVEVTQEHVASEKQDDGHGDVGDEVGVNDIVVSPDKVDSLSAEPVSGDLSVVEETGRAAPDDGVDEEKGDETSINEDNVVLPDKVDDSTAEPQSGDLSSVEETVTAAPDDGHAVDGKKGDEASINNEKDKVDESSAERDLSIVEETVVDEEKGDEASINNENVVLPDKVDDTSAEPQSGDLSFEETETAAPEDGHVVDEERGDEASINNENAALPYKIDDSSAEPTYGNLSIVEETETDFPVNADVPVNALDDSVNVVEKESEAVNSDGLNEAAVPKEDGSEPGTAFTEEKEEETKAAEIQKSEMDQTDDKVGELVEKQDGAASIDELAEDKSLENTELLTEENTAAAEFITQDDASTEAVTSQEDEIKNESAACTENEEENDGSDQTAVEKVDEELQVVGQEDKAVEEVAPGEEKKIENASPEKPEDPAVPVVEKNEETAEPAIVEGSEEVAEPVVVEENEELAEPSTVKPAETVVEDVESDAVVREAATETSQDSGEEKPEVVKSEELVTDQVDEHEQVQDREVGEDNVKVSDTTCTAEEDSSDAAAVASQEEESAGDADNTNASTGGEEGSKDIKNEHSLPLDEASGKLEEQVQVDEKELLVTDGSVEEESVAKRSLEAFPPENSEDEVAISTGGDNTVEEEATSGIVDVEESLKEEENTSIMVSQGDAGGADDSDDGGFVGTTHNSIGESLLLTDEEEVGPGKEVTMEDAATKENAVDFPSQESTPGNDEEKPAADLPENIRQDFVATSTENLEENTTGDRELVDFEGAQIQEEASGDVVQLSEDKVTDVEETEATSAENVNEDEQDETHEEVPSLHVECDKEATDASEQGADPGLDTAADVQPEVQINESLEKNGDEAFEQQTVVDGGTVSAVEDETIEEGEAVKVEEEEGKGAEVEEGTADQKAIEVDHKEFEEETKGKVDAEVVDEPEPASKVVQAELEKDGGAEVEEERAEEAGEVHADAEEATGEAGVEEEDAVKVSADEETVADKEKEEGGETLNANGSDGVAELGTQTGATPEECNMAPETGSEVEVETVTGAEALSSDYETTKKLTFEEAPDAEQTAAPGATPEKDSEQGVSEKVDQVLDQEAAHLPEGPVPVSTEREIHEDIVPTSDQEPAPVVEEKSAEKEEGQGDAEVEEETAGGVHADVEEGTPEAEIDEDGVKVSENTTVDRDIGEADTENDGESDDKTADGVAEVGTETETCIENGIGNEVEASVGVDGLGNSDIQTTKKISFEEALFTDQEAQQQLSSAQAEGNKDGVIVERESSPVAVSGDLEKSNTGARSVDSRGIVASALGSIVTAAMNLAKTTKPSKKKRLKLKKELAKQLQPV